MIIADIHAAYKYLVEKLNYKWHNIILYFDFIYFIILFFRYGESLGSGPSVYLGSQRKTPVGGIILHSSLTSGLRVLNKNISKTHKQDLFPNIDLIKYINTWVFIIHGKKDTMIPIINAERLYSLVKRPHGPWFVEEGAHNNIRKIDIKRYFQELFKFIEVIHSHK